MQGNDQVQGYKDCPDCLIPDPTMVGSEENLWFLDALKRSISELTLPEKTWKGIKLFFFLFFLNLRWLLGLRKLRSSEKKISEYFANGTYFASCIMKKHFFLLWTKETVFFTYFYHGIIFNSTELFECAVNFKFYLSIFIFLNINTNQTSKEQYLN